MIRKREIIVQKQEDGRELLDWISSRYTYHSKEKWTEYITEGRIEIDGGKVSTDKIIKTGELIIYYPEPIIEPPVNGKYQTIYEDEDLLVINKPCDLPCHPGGIYFENTLWYILKKKYDYISLINRLDRETSGVMLIAKNKISAKFYFNKMMEREIDKEYLVLVHGNINKEISGKGWLAPSVDSVIRKKRDFILDLEAFQQEGQSDPLKQYSHTEFYPITNKENITLLGCKIFTGRTHQIRATICSIGYPVVGDKIYGLDDSYFFKFINDQLSIEEWDKLMLKNQALHSWKTTLPMMDGDIKTFEAPKPINWPI